MIWKFLWNPNFWSIQSLFFSFFSISWIMPASAYSQKCINLPFSNKGGKMEQAAKPSQSCKYTQHKPKTASIECSMTQKSQERENNIYTSGLSARRNESTLLHIKHQLCSISPHVPVYKLSNILKNAARTKKERFFIALPGNTFE